MNTAATLLFEELKKRISLPDEEILGFINLWEVKSYKRNELIMQAGEVPKFSIFVTKGCLRQYSTNEDGEETIVYFAEERHFLGDLPAMRTKTVSGFSFQALEDCELLVLTVENWNKAQTLFPWWIDVHLLGFQKWAVRMQQQLIDMQSKSGEVRYQTLLKERPSLFQRVPQHYIASYLGLSPETLSRIRKKIALG